MRRALLIAFYTTLALVIVSEARTVFVALIERDRFVATVPAARGAWLRVIVATSAAAGLNAILVGLRIRWAVWVNLAIGAWSILLLILVRAPLTNAAVVAVACAVTVGVPLLTWIRE